MIRIQSFNGYTFLVVIHPLVQHHPLCLIQYQRYRLQMATRLYVYFKVCVGYLYIFLDVFEGDVRLHIYFYRRNVTLNYSKMTTRGVYIITLKRSSMVVVRAAMFI